MNRILFSFFLIAVFVIIGCSNSTNNSDDSRGTTINTKNDRDQTTKIERTDEEIISYFNEYMGWYHEQIEYDKEAVQTRKIDNSTYSIKYKVSIEQQKDMMCIDGSMCRDCLGKGTVFVEYDAYLGKSITQKCSTCKGSGKVKCEYTTVEYTRIAQLVFKNRDTFVVSL
tara:strand:- start:1141 stop:1647 length:507 start_codon:yes stop_codon:yes gene_type:complete